MGDRYTRSSENSQSTPHGEEIQRQIKHRKTIIETPEKNAEGKGDELPELDMFAKEVVSDKEVVLGEEDEMSDAFVEPAAATATATATDAFAVEQKLYGEFYSDDGGATRYLKSCNTDPEQDKETIRYSQIVINERKLRDILSRKIETLERKAELDKAESNRKAESNGEAVSNGEAFSLDTRFLYPPKQDEPYYKRGCDDELRELQSLLVSNGFRTIMMHDSENGHIFFYLMHEVYDVETGRLVEKLVGKLEWTITCVEADNLKGRINKREITKETQIPVCHISWVGSYANGMKLATVMERIAMFYSFLFANVKTGHKENATELIFTEFDYNNWDLLFFPLGLAFSDYSIEPVATSSKDSSQDESFKSTQESSEPDSPILSDHSSDDDVIELEEQSPNQVLKNTIIQKQLIYDFYRPLIMKAFSHHDIEELLSSEENPKKKIYKDKIEEIIKNNKYFKNFLFFIEENHKVIIENPETLKKDVERALNELTEHGYLYPMFYTSEGRKLFYKIADDVHVSNVLELLDRDVTLRDDEGNTYFQNYKTDVEERMRRLVPQLMLPTHSSLGGSSPTKKRRKKITYKTKKVKRTKRNKGRTKRNKGTKRTKRNKVKNKGRTKRRKNQKE